MSTEVASEAMARRSRGLKRHARAMRHEPTRGEARLWHWLRGRKFHGYKFRRQVPIGRYIVDFYCAELRLGVELDGSQHSQLPNARYDDVRTRELQRLGVRIVRIALEQLLSDDRAVIRTLELAAATSQASVAPLP